MDDVSQALKDHWEWRANLQKAIVDGRSDLSPRDVAATDRCALGKWLNTGVSPEFRQTQLYEHVVELHTEFHHRAAHILQLALSGRQEEAREEMKRDSVFGTSSDELSEALKQWKGASQQTPGTPE